MCLGLQQASFSWCLLMMTRTAAETEWPKRCTSFSNIVHVLGLKFGWGLKILVPLKQGLSSDL